MRHPRYVVRSITGYPTAGRAGDGKQGTTWWVADTWCCWRECRLQVVGEGRLKWSGRTTPSPRVAHRNCERLNREHDEWLAGA